MCVPASGTTYREVSIMPGKRGSGTNAAVVVKDISAVTASLDFHRQFLKKPKVSGSDTEAVEERIEDYFRLCSERDALPTIEGMSLALGVDRSTLWNWSKGQGCTRGTTEAVQRAKTLLSAMDAELASKGKIQPVTYIFRSKNFYGLSDKVEIATETKATDLTMLSREELEARYSMNIIPELDTDYDK